jgi:hypothetical protein
MPHPPVDPGSPGAEAAPSPRLKHVTIYAERTHFGITEVLLLTTYVKDEKPATLRAELRRLKRVAKIPGTLRLLPWE